MLRIAVQSKGRLFEETMALLQEADIKISTSKRILLVQSSNFPIDLEGKDIVYVFIAGENSPKETWDNMIPDIHGEHYRVTAAQWKYLSKQFSIQGVPTYIIVDKEGAVIQKHTGFPGVDTVKKELMKALEK